MSDRLKKTVISAIVAVGLALAVSYGLISQQTADSIKSKADQTLSQDQTPQTQQPQTAPAPQQPTTQGADTPPQPAQPNTDPATAPRQ